MQDTDVELIEQYENGAKSSLNILIERYLGAVYNLSFRLLGRKEEVEDITQEVFLKVIRNLHKFDKNKNFKVWIYSITRNTVTDYFRKKKSLNFSSLNSEDEDVESFEANIKDESDDQFEILERKENLILLEKALDNLSEDEKLIISLKHTEDMTFFEIGEIMSEPLNTVKSRYLRALKKMKTNIKK
ncbi:MAG: sigma-70 family RNA polymerase sigma factor [Minisyncoccia bacterium]